METIIGFVLRADQVERIVQRLQENGVAGDNISRLTQARVVRRLLVPLQHHLREKYMALGIVLGILAYGLAGIAAGICYCDNAHLTLVYAAGKLLIFLGLGTLLGTILGYLAGTGESEQDTHLYVQGVDRGGVVLAVQAAGAEVAKVERVLRGTGVFGVKTLRVFERQSRSHGLPPVRQQPRLGTGGL